MARDYSIKATVEVVNKAVRPLNKIGAAFSKLSKKIDNTSKKLSVAGKKMSDVGKNLSTRLTLPIVALGAIAVNTRKKFEQSMNKVAAVTQATGEQFKAMEKLAMELGRTTQFSASEAADAMSFLGMAGLNTDKIMEALPGTLQLAAAGGLDLASAADIATNVMTSMGMGVKDLTHINDVLATAQAKANTNVYELAEAMRPVAGTASTLGVSIEELTAMLGKMADSGEKGGIAGTLLRNAMLALVKPTDSARKSLSKYGININDFVTKGGKLKNFSDLIEKIQKAGMTTGEIFQVFGERGARAILTLSKQGKNLKEFTKQLGDSEGAAQKMADQMMKGLPGAMKRLSSAWEGLMLKLTSGDVGDFINKLINKIVELINWFSNLSPATLKIIVVLAGIAAVVGPLLFILGKFIVAISAIMKLYKLFTAAQWLLNLAMAANPVGLIIIGITALIALIVVAIKNWDTFGASMMALLGPLGMTVSLFKTLYDRWGSIKEAFRTGGILGALKEIGKAIIESVLMPIQQLLQIISKIPGVGKFAKIGAEKIGKFRESFIKAGPEGESNVNIKEIDKTAAEKIGTSSLNKVIKDQNFSGLFSSLKPASAEARTEVEVKVSAEDGSSATINKVKSTGKQKINIKNQSNFGRVYSGAVTG